MKAVSLTNRGGRVNNEDYVNSAQAENLWCYVVCDGLGGHDGGEIASRAAAEAICAAFKENPEISPEAMRGYFNKALESVTEERGREGAPRTMSTTAAVLVTDGKEAVWAHIGDSRVYYIEKGEISTITDDHSIAFLEFENGFITYDEIRKSPNQNKLTRCIGGFAAFEPDISDTVSVGSGDAFLLCSDGFWELVNEDDIERTLSKSAVPKVWLEDMLECLHENETEHNDNYSAIAVMI